MNHVLVTSAIELTDGQSEKIKKAVTKKYGKDVEIRFDVDADLIGGLTITDNSRQLDGSLKYKLDQIKKVFA